MRISTLEVRIQGYTGTRATSLPRSQNSKCWSPGSTIAGQSSRNAAGGSLKQPDAKLALKPMR